MTRDSMNFTRKKTSEINLRPVSSSDFSGATRLTASINVSVEKIWTCKGERDWKKNCLDFCMSFFDGPKILQGAIFIDFSQNSNSYYFVTTSSTSSVDISLEYNTLLEEASIVKSITLILSSEL